MTSTAIVGSTGLVGTHILSTLLALPTITSISSLSRREPATTDPKLHPLVSTESSQWATQLSSVSPPPVIFFSALGTTRGAAGSVEAQRAIDYDLNFALATAAKKSGVKVYVLISTSGANSKSSLAYPRMKGELEDSIKGLEFEHTIILRPGLIVGDREESRPAEAVIRSFAKGLSYFGLSDFWSQGADVIAKAAVSAGLKVLGDESKPKVWEVGQSEIVKLGKTEWKA